MQGFAKFTVHGRVVADPELTSLTNGTSRCRLRCAVNKRFKDKSGESREKTTWLTLTLFGKFADTLAKFEGLKGVPFVANGDFDSYEREVGENKVTTYGFKPDTLSLMFREGTKDLRGSDQQHPPPQPPKEEPKPEPPQQKLETSSGDPDEFAGDDEIPF